MKKLVGLSQPEEIYLFGSAAEGKMNRLSDLDFCIVFSSKDAVKNSKKKIFSQPPFSEFAIDWVLVDRDTFDRKKELGGVCFDAFKYGRKVYPQE